MSDQKRDAAASIPAFRDPTELANAVISTLQVPPEPTQVAVSYSNQKNASAEVQAYAKIAGRNWTFYVKTLAVSIGRSTDPGPQGGAPAQGQTHIDLGPAKVVSRHHASITYNAQLRCWELQVLGRNGARVDGVKVAVGVQGAVPLHSGAILDVGGTQMMFILPDTPPSIAPKLLSSCLARYSPENAESHKRQKTADAGSRMSSFQMFEKGAASAVSLQSNLDQDLSREDSKDIKPPYSYATMITQAILSNADGVMSLAEIYAWISSRYAYYKYSKTGWQNSIRHNLSLNKAFEKVPRRPNEPGKGMKWQISDAYRNDFLSKVSSGTLSKSRRGSSVSRTLQIHLATHQGLPEAKGYAKIPAKNDAGGENGAALGAGAQNHLQAPLNPANPSANPSKMDQLHGVPQQQGFHPIGPGQTYPMLPQQGPQDFHMPYGSTGYPPPGPYPPNPQNMREMQNYSNVPPDARESDTHARAHNHNLPNGLPNGQNGHQNGSNGPQGPQNGQTFAPGINLFKAATPAPKSDIKYEPKMEHQPSENGRTSGPNSSHIPNSTAPSTSNNSELGLHFTSPKKIAPLEAFTPERGSKSGNFAKSGGQQSMGQSSPAFWNFVQFSTPNGQTPGRKNSDESNGQESPTLKRGDKAVGLYDDSPPK